VTDLNEVYMILIKFKTAFNNYPPIDNFSTTSNCQKEQGKNVIDINFYKVMI
jgi:hypothetical protein